METAHDRRKRKLEELCSREGGIKAVADRADVNPATLDQILKGTLLPPKKDGSRSARGVGNELARTLERAFELGIGWFDNAETPAKPSSEAATPTPGPQSAGRHEVSDSEWAMVQDLRDLPQADRKARMGEIHAEAERWREVVERVLLERGFSPQEVQQRSKKAPVSEKSSYQLPRPFVVAEIEGDPNSHSDENQRVPGARHRRRA